MPTKAVLRREYRAKRESFSSKELTHASTQILERVITQNLVPDGLLMLYIDSPMHKELPMQKWFEYFKHNQICVPKVINSNGHMEAVLWTKDVPLIPNKWGILEPERSAFIDSKIIKTVIVPLLCFDRYGQRLGYGKGYYDRFLARCAKNVKTIGVSAFDAVDTIDDITAQDHKLTCAVTPNKVYLF